MIYLPLGFLDRLMMAGLLELPESQEPLELLESLESLESPKSLPTYRSLFRTEPAIFSTCTSTELESAHLPFYR